MKTLHLKSASRIALISGLLFVAPQLFAHDLFFIKGRIMNTKTDPIKGATVTLSDPKTLEPVATGKCKSNGEFFVDNVPEGEYIMSVKKDGAFRGKTKRVIIDHEGNMVMQPVEKNDSIAIQPDLSNI